MATIASFKEVSVRRGKVKALKNVSLEVENGQLIGVLGPSGAGKSTMLRSIVGVQKGVSGKLQVLQLPAGAKSLRTRISYSTQASSVFDDLTVRQNLAFACQILGAPKNEVNRVIADVQLQGFEKVRVGNLSGGQRNRVSLAMAMVGNPEVLILDEPTVGLDPVLRSDLWAIFRQLADQGKTVFVSSHVMDEAERCDRIIFVRDGEIIAFDTLQNIKRETGTESAEDSFLKLARSQK